MKIYKKVNILDVNLTLNYLLNISAATVNYSSVYSAILSIRITMIPLKIMIAIKSKSMQNFL